MQEEKEYKLTKNGIAYDLNYSPYKYDVNYKDYNLTYIFSSELNMKKYVNKYKEYRQKTNDGLKYQYRIDYDIDLDVMWDLKFYESIEKRGFLVIMNSEVKVCKDFLRLDGLRMIIKD